MFIQELFKKKKIIPDYSFSIYLPYIIGETGGKLILGGINPQFAASEFRYVPADFPSKSSVKLDDFLVGNYSLSIGNMDALIDVGTSTIMIDWRILNSIKISLPPLNDCSNLQVFPKTSFVIKEISFDLEPEDYILTQKKNGKVQCILGPTEKHDKNTWDRIILENTTLTSTLPITASASHLQSG
eukprot:TRINITY_DN10285_c0_g1_i1.p1 TRINITY_DN10285_c0_g1~~TRINITY_DN10285_c0_g1_i1.p1  ORF type:complete len:185 (+),score=37.55 TRINITY_DN10285_c0_g1_i1:524-1078(+)